MKLCKNKKSLLYSYKSSETLYSILYLITNIYWYKAINFYFYIRISNKKIIITINLKSLLTRNMYLFIVL